MSGVIAAAVAVGRERTQLELERRKAEREAVVRRWHREQRSLEDGPIDFHKALRVLRAKVRARRGPRGRLLAREHHRLTARASSRLIAA